MHSSRRLLAVVSLVTSVVCASGLVACKPSAEKARAAARPSVDSKLARIAALTDVVGAQPPVAPGETPAKVPALDFGRLDGDLDYPEKKYPNAAIVDADDLGFPDRPSPAPFRIENGKLYPAARLFKDPSLHPAVLATQIEGAARRLEALRYVVVVRTVSLEKPSAVDEHLETLDGGDGRRPRGLALTVGLTPGRFVGDAFVISIEDARVLSRFRFQAKNLTEIRPPGDQAGLVGDAVGTYTSNLREMSEIALFKTLETISPGASFTCMTPTYASAVDKTLNRVCSAE